MPEYNLIMQQTTGIIFYRLLVQYHASHIQTFRLQSWKSSSVQKIQGFCAQSLFPETTDGDLVCCTEGW